MNIKESNLRKEYWRYIIPSLIAQIVFTLYTLVDALMVARGVSPIALAGVNIAMPYVTVIWAIAITFAVGTSTIIARLMGAGDEEKADQVFSQTLFFLLIFSAIFSVITFLGAGAIGNFLGATENTRDATITYIRVIAPFTFPYVVSYMLEILMPVDGNPRMASIVVTIGAVLNCILDYLFIFIFNWGVWGAAFATGFSQLVCAVIFALHFLGKKSNIKLCRFDMDWSLIGQELKRGIPAGITDISPGLVIYISVFFITRYIGEAGLLANSTISYSAGLLMICAVGIGQGSQPLISYWNGAKRPDLIRKIFHWELKDTLVIGSVAFAIMELAAPAIVGFFMPGESQEMIAYSIRAFRIVMTMGLFCMYNIVLAQYTTALEKPFTGSLIQLLRSSLSLVIGDMLMIAVMGPEGIWFGMTVSEMLTLVTAVVLYKKNRGYIK